MMCVAGFFLAILAFLAVVVLAAWLASLVLFIAGRINRSTILTVVSAGAFLVLTVFSALAIVHVVHLISDYRHATSPPEVFRRSFGFEPLPDVKDIQSEYYYLFDSGYTYLKFQASPTTVERIVARGLEQVPGSYPFPSSNLEPPDWWTPPATGDVIRYYGEFDGRDFASEDEILIYDRSSNTVYFHFLGID